MYAASVLAFLQMLKNLTAILEKAEAFAEERDIELTGGVLAEESLALFK
jgi:hypothetical protein